MGEFFFISFFNNSDLPLLVCIGGPRKAAWGKLAATPRNGTGINYGPNTLSGYFYWFQF